MPVDEDDPEDIDEDAEDHAWEECGRFLEHRPIPPRVRPYRSSTSSTRSAEPNTSASSSAADPAWSNPSRCRISS
jgi:hypothetical protein